METTLIQTHTRPAGQRSLSTGVVRPARLVLGRPQPKCSVKTIWDSFRMSKAWGDALELYDLGQE
ncbi:hypothetical protein [uncultured Meiothermus sp.]|uniref:hypothetical protein n=1 Tax=uncultured Meiothermus sp. TaxID=157471 RepID=UPI002634E665|nr:hypothetical protein [uncultured Meiothermus sp.]